MALLDSLTPELVGRRYPEMKFHLTETWVRDYKEAIEYPSELINDPNFVPQLFFACLRDAEFYVFDTLGIHLSQLLHAGQRYEFSKPFVVGEVLISQSHISSLRRKETKSGPMIFMELTTDVTLAPECGGQHFGRAYMTVVVRNQ